MKKFLIVGFVLASLCAIAQTEKANAVEFEFEIQDGRATLTGTSAGSSIAGDLVLPQTLGGCPVTSIGELAFSRYSGLASVTIPPSVTRIDDGAFEGCSALKTFVVDKDNPKFTAINGLLCTKDGSTVVAGVSGDVTIPPGVTDIEFCAFADCRGLTSVTVPPSVTSVGLWAFLGCSALKTFVVDKENPKFTAINGLLCTKDGLTVIAGVSGDVTIPPGVTSIGDLAFVGCRGLTSVTLPSSVTDIGFGAFADCSGLTSVTIPSSVTSIWSWAFRFCSGLKTVYTGKGDSDRVKNLLESSGLDAVPKLNFIEEGSQAQEPGFWSKLMQWFNWD